MQIKSKIIYSFNENSEMETQKTEQQKDKRQPNPQLRANAFVCSREKSMKHLIKISSVSRHGCNFVSSNDHRAWSWCHVILPLEETITLLPITSAPESVSMTALAHQQSQDQTLPPPAGELNQVRKLSFDQSRLQEYPLFITL